VPFIGPAWETAYDLQEGDYADAAFNAAMLAAEFTPAAPLRRVAKIVKDINRSRRAPLLARDATQRARIRKIVNAEKTHIGKAYEVHHTIPFKGLRPIPKADRKAEGLWRKAVAKDPNEPMLIYNLGLAARRLGNLDEAARRFRDTIRRAPTHVEARLALASIHMDMGRFAAAERELSEFVANVDRAIQEHGTEALKPMQARARNMLGYALYRLGQHSAAIEVFDMALQDAGDNAERRGQILGDRSLSLAALGHYDEAIAEAGRALELAPGSATLNHTVGFVLYFSGRPSDAIPHLEKALELDPAFTVALNTMALARTAAGQTDQATEILKKVLERDPHDQDSVLQLSNLYVQLGRFDEALQVLDPYLKAVSGDARAMNNQGLALLGLKRFDDARRILKKAARLTPDDPFVQTNFGRALMGLGRAAEARSHHEHALRGLPGDSRLLAHYGICLAALGENDRARETLDAALAADPNNEEALLARAGLDA